MHLRNPCRCSLSFLNHPEKLEHFCSDKVNEQDEGLLGKPCVGHHGCTNRAENSEKLNFTARIR